MEGWGFCFDRREPAWYSTHVRILRVLFLLVVVGLSSCVHAAPELATVRRVIDGDTVELAGGRLVRYIGIDAPETRRREGEQWIDDPEPFGREATEANRRLVEGKTVRLDYDVERLDPHDRLLAYVYVGEQMVNERLLAEGYAVPLTIPPNVKYAERFRDAATQARTARRGLWAAER